MEIDDTSHFREQALQTANLARLISEALGTERTDGKDAAIGFLVSNGYPEPDAREVLDREGPRECSRSDLEGFGARRTGTRPHTLSPLVTVKGCI